MPAGKQFAAGGGVGRAQLKVGETDSLIVQEVYLRNLEDRMAIAGKVPLAPVFGEDDDDVRFCPGGQSAGGREGVRNR